MPPQQINPPSPIQEQASAVSPTLQHTWNKFALLALGTFVFSFLINPWVNPVARYFGSGIITSLAGIILPFLTLFFAIKAIRGIRKNGGKGKSLSWIILLLNLIVLFFAVISALFFFTFVGLSISNFAVTNSASNENSNIPPANESIEIVGPTLESERGIYESQAKANNNINFYFNESGTAVGYGVGTVGFSVEYVENGVVHGPIVGMLKQYPESDEQFWTRMETVGWKVGMRERWRIENTDSKSGHTLESIPTGPELNCFDSQNPSQSSLIYDGKQVGLHSIQDGRCRSPVKGVLLSNDGLHYAYLVQAKHGYFVVVDGKKSEIYPLLSNLHFEGSTFVFNAVSSDFMNFVRAKILTSSQNSVTNTAMGEQVANTPTSAPLNYSVIRVTSPNGGEALKIGYKIHITWEASPPPGVWLDLELFEINGDKPNIASNGQCLNCIGGGLRSGVSAISPITNGAGGIDWVVGKLYAGGYVKSGSHYVLKANINKTGSPNECPAKFPNCTVDLGVDWSDAAFSLTN